MLSRSARTLLALVIFVVLTGRALTQENLNAQLEVTRGKYHLPGVLAMVVQEGRVVASGQAGVRQVRRAEVLTIGDPVNIGSCTKSMTAVVAGRLVDRQVIRWETRVRDLFKEYSTFHPSLAEATLEQLLSHRAGVEAGETWERVHWGQLAKQTGTVTQIRRWVAQTALRDAPGVTPGEYLYSNQGVTIAGAMLELATGQSWEELIQQELFIPLQMTSATLGITQTGNIPPDAPVGHSLVDATAQPTADKPWSHLLLQQYQASGGPAGFVKVPLQQWALFLRALHGKSPGYLQPATLQKIVTPLSSNGYALGLFAAPRGWASPGPALNHSGIIFGQTSVFWTAPAKDLCVMVYTNCRSKDGTCSKALDEVAGELIGRYAK